MIVSDSHRFIFLHNPKCGGMTVRKSLEQFDTTNLLFWGRLNFAPHKATAKEHMPMALFRQLFPEQFALLDSYFVFAFVREPYARAVSAYNQFMRKEEIFRKARSDDPEQVAEYRRALNDFYEQLRPRALSGETMKYRHLVPQRDIIYLGEKCQADMVLRTEDWDRSLAALGVFRPDLAEAIANQKKVNVKSMPSARESYLEPRAIRRINRLYKDDFLLFGYPMQLV